MSISRASPGCVQCLIIHCNRLLFLLWREQSRSGTSDEKDVLGGIGHVLDDFTCHNDQTMIQGRVRGRVNACVVDKHR